MTMAQTSPPRRAFSGRSSVTNASTVMMNQNMKSRQQQGGSPERHVPTPTFNNRKNLENGYNNAGPDVTPTRTNSDSNHDFDEKNKTKNNTTPNSDKKGPRKTNIQVCIRLRPILPSDKKQKVLTHTVGLGKATSRESTTHAFPSAAANHHHQQHNSNSNPSAPGWTIHPDGCSVIQTPETNPDPSRKNTYTFDHAFGPDKTTLDLYDSVVKENVQAFMEGYHASVFAYGQTATGKTFTMTGKTSTNQQQRGNYPSSSSPHNSFEDENSLGIVQLAIRDCFDYINNEHSPNREFLLRCSFVEIYNEVIHDLLATPTITQPKMNMSTSTSSSSNHHAPPLSHGNTAIRIFESKSGEVIVRGLKEEIVTSYDEVMELLAMGEKRRQTGSTALNKKSSRSHSIFRLTVESRKRTQKQNFTRRQQHPHRPATSSGDSIASSVFKGTGPVRISTLSLVDLAGSESVKNTGSTGTRQKEGQFINKSLLTLGHVVWKLADFSKKSAVKDAAGGGSPSQMDAHHIPYRDSKLTRLLQPSLSGNCQICFLCNISPIAKHLEESHNTLKFATRAKRIKQHATVTEVADEKTLLENYREEIDELKAQLKEAKKLQEDLMKNSNSGGNNNDTSGTGGDDQQTNGSGGGTTNGPNQDVDVQVIVQAIHNLERVILKTTTATEKKRKKKRKQEKKIKDFQQVVQDQLEGKNSKEVNSFDSGLLSMDDNESLVTNDDTLLNMLDAKNIDEDDLLDMSLVSKGYTRNGSSKTMDDFSVISKGDTSIGDDTLVENKNLISDLHRIQGMLASVLMRKGTPENGTSPREGVGNIQVLDGEPITSLIPTSPSILKDEEVERLRTQLHDQAVVTSLKQADTSFLQQQLEQKDNILKEVSKILEVVEQRQMQLEKENFLLKEDWAKSVGNLRAKESECKKTVKLLKMREMEIMQLRKQLDEMKGIGLPD